MSVVRRWVSAVGPVITGVCSEKKVLTSTVIEAESVLELNGRPLVKNE